MLPMYSTPRLIRHVVRVVLDADARGVHAQAMAEDPPLPPGALLRRIARIALSATLEPDPADMPDASEANRTRDAQYLMPQSAGSDYPNGASDDSDVDIDELQEPDIAFESAR